MEILNSILNHIDTETLTKLGLSALLGLIMGIERASRKKPIGIKTLVVVTVASCLLTIISHKSLGIHPEGNVVQDPLRLPAQIISGIGFLGAGIIWKRNNDVVNGLTSAAILWSLGATGIAIGAGFISEAITAIIIILFSIELLPWLIEKVTKIKVNEKVITMKVTINKEKETKEVMKIIKQCNVVIKNVDVMHSKSEPNDFKIIKIRGYIPQGLYVTSICDDLSKIEDILEIDIRE